MYIHDICPNSSWRTVKLGKELLHLNRTVAELWCYTEFFHWRKLFHDRIWTRQGKVKSWGTRKSDRVSRNRGGKRTSCVNSSTASSRVPGEVDRSLDPSRYPRAQRFVHVHTFAQCYTRNGSHDAWHACAARMTWRVCGSILISWWSGGYWAASQNSPYCCVSAHAPSPRFRPFASPFSPPPSISLSLPPPSSCQPLPDRDGTPHFLRLFLVFNGKVSAGGGGEREREEGIGRR